MGKKDVAFAMYSIFAKNMVSDMESHLTFDDNISVHNFIRNIDAPILTNM